MAADSSDAVATVAVAAAEVEEHSDGVELVSVHDAEGGREAGGGSSALAGTVATTTGAAGVEGHEERLLVLGVDTAGDCALGPS